LAYLLYCHPGTANLFGPSDAIILNNEQYGFRPKLNTDNATYQLTNGILDALNNKLLIAGIFCDLEKAFDCVNHKLLLFKLKTWYN
jgi:hypothetical protein